jgi:hypothetical protein
VICATPPTRTAAARALYESLGFLKVPIAGYIKRI